GRRAADCLKLPFFDTDVMACERLEIGNVLEQFRATLNGSFMWAQQKAVHELSELADAAIIATGAEIALMPGYAYNLRRMGTVIHIRRDREIILADMANDGKNRSTMQDMQTGTEVVMREQAVRLYAQELSQYETLAHYTLDNNGSEDVGLENLLAIINQKG
ncbi:MAG: shikimate kinase, partial [Thermoguttaceae bacterium]